MQAAQYVLLPLNHHDFLVGLYFSFKKELDPAFYIEKNTESLPFNLNDQL